MPAMSDKRGPAPAPKGVKGREAFPNTMLSAVLGTSSPELVVRTRSWDRVARAYRPAVVRYVALRFRRSESDAEDLASAFFARCVERDTFGKFEPKKARFRTFLRTCLDRFVTDEIRAQKSLKRGAGKAEAAVGAEVLEALPDQGAESALAAFDAEWNRRVVSLAIEALKQELETAGKKQHLEIFQRFYLASDDPPSYAAIATELKIAVHDVTNRLHYARKRFRAAALEVLRDLTASEEEWREEAKAVLGVEP
jgi:RNA polymerase sigma factor (sigma-70 family)